MFVDRIQKSRCNHQILKIGLPTKNTANKIIRSFYVFLLLSIGLSLLLLLLRDNCSSSRGDSAVNLFFVSSLIACLLLLILLLLLLSLLLLLLLTKLLVCILFATKLNHILIHRNYNSIVVSSLDTDRFIHNDSNNKDTRGIGRMGQQGTSTI